MNICGMTGWKRGRFTHFRRLLLKIQSGSETNPASATFLGRPFQNFHLSRIGASSATPHGSWALRPESPKPPLQPEIRGQMPGQRSAACARGKHILTHPVRKSASRGELQSCVCALFFLLVSLCRTTFDGSGGTWLAV